jgi:hypothetical protein
MAKNVTKGYYSVVTHVHLWHEFDNWLCKVSCCLHMYFLWRHHLPPDKSENDQDSDSDWFTYCIQSIDMWLLALLFITQPVSCFVFHLPNLLLTENFVYPTLLSSTPASYPGAFVCLRHSIKLIHSAHAKATQAIEQHIAPGYEAAPDHK